MPVGGESGLLDVRDRALVLQEHKPSSQRQAQSYDIWDAFVDKVLSFVDVSAIGPLKVVIDAANGMAGAMLPPVLERLPIDAVTCYFEPDGSFPNHEPNPLLPENREFIVAKTLDGAGRPRRRLRRRRRPLLLRRRHRRVRPGRLRHRAARRVDPREGARRQRHLRRAREPRRAADDRARRRHRPDQPGRPRLHQAPHAQGGRRLRRRGLRALLLPRLLPGRLGRRPVPAPARADLEERPQALGAARALPRAVLPHRRDQHARRRRGAEAAASWRSATPTAPSPSSTGSRSTTTTGTSTSAPRTPSRCSASTWRRSRRSRWSGSATRCSS